MKEKFLVINAGSSSLKFSLYNMPEAIELANGYIEKIGNTDSFYTIKSSNAKIEKSKLISNHTEAVEVMIKELLDNRFINSIDEIKGIGHRILHGGEYYSKSVLIDNDALNNIKSLIKLGPLHLPGEISGVESMINRLSNVPQVAVFDTAFHQTIPEENYLYPVPYEWYEEDQVRKYGFHGTSHKYITEMVQKLLGKDNVNLIICHIGSGCSMAAIKDGKSIDTTMGLTPLDGLMMGTRCGAIDPAIISYENQVRNLSIEEINNILNKESGLKGICGKNDFRDILALSEQGDHKAKLALAMFEKSIIKYIGQYYIELDGKVDAIVFTAGVGENCILFRENVVNSISNALGIELDKEANDSIAKFKEKTSGIISTPNSKIKVMVIPTNEEYMILKDTYELSEKKYIKSR